MTNILIVDDMQFQLDVLAYVLNQNGYQVTAATNGKEALKTFEHTRPDIIICDIYMPVMDGLVFCKTIKSDPKLADIPIVLLTSADRVGDVINGLNAGADGYLTKPYIEAVLLKTITNTMKMMNTAIDSRGHKKDNLATVIDGRKHTIQSSHQQTLNYFIGAYNSAAVNNSMLIKSQQQIKELNDKLTASLDNLSASEERFRSLVHTIPDIVYKLDNEGHFTFLNEAIEQLGYSQTELYGQHFSTIICENDINLVSREKVLPHIQGQNVTPPKLFDERRTIERMTSGLELRLKTKQGTITDQVEVSSVSGPLTYVEVNCSGVYGEHKSNQRAYIGTVGVIRDIADRKSAEEKMQLAMEMSDKANQAKSEFLSSMSHELRTPLNSILGFAQVLQFNPKEPLSNAQKSAVKYILKGGQHLLELINDILDLARIEAGKVNLSLEDMSLKPVISDCIMTIQSLAQSREIELEVSSFFNELTVFADTVRLKQVLLNLLSNACKYNRQGGQIKVEGEIIDNNILKIIISDTGRGIAKAKWGELFKPFNRLGAEATDIEGTGIGLSVSKQLIQLMAGDIGLDSEVGKGSAFWFTIPLGTTTEPPVDEFIAATLSLPNTSGLVLYVEDNPDNQKLMEMVIQGLKGLRLITTHNAEFGIELARTEQPDLIVLDINLPGMSGIEALKIFKRSKDTSHIPVIALSAAATQADIEKGIAAGFRYYLTKPMQILEMISTIKIILDDKVINPVQ